MNAARKFKNFLGALLLCAALYCYLFFRTTHPSLPSAAEPLIFYSNHLNDDLKRVVLHAIKEAQESIEIQIYSLTDPDLIALLNRKANEGVRIKISFDPKATHGLEQRCHKSIELVPVRLSGLMHRKLLLIDSSQLFIGTANFTPSSLHYYDNLLMGLYHEKAVPHLVDRSDQPLPLDIAQQRIDLFLLPDAREAGIKKITTLMREAKKQIYLALFTFTHPLLSDVAIEASRRGVDVQLILDGSAAAGSSQNIKEKFKNAGLKVLERPQGQLLHHKWIWIDDTLILGSANWTQAAFSKNRDCFLILSPLSAAQENSLKTMWRIFEIEQRSNQ